MRKRANNGKEYEPRSSFIIFSDLYKEPHNFESMNPDVERKIIALGKEAVEPLIEAMRMFAGSMRTAVAQGLGFPSALSRRTWHEEREIDKVVCRRTRPGYGQKTDKRHYENRFPVLSNIVRGAALVLTQIGKEAVMPLVALADNKREDWILRVEAVWALGVIGDKRAFPVVKKLARWWNIFELGEVRIITRKTARNSLKQIKKNN